MYSEQQRIEDLQERLRGLIGRADTDEVARAAADEALGELSIVIEELRSQNRELATSRAALEVRTRRAQELFEMVADGYLSTDVDGIIQEVNRSACEMFGRPRDQVLGLPLATFIEPVDRGAFHAQPNRIRRAEAGDHVTVRLTVHDHEPIPTSLRATHASSGGDDLILWLLRDRRHDLVTDALRSSEERLRIVFDSANVGILLGDTTGELVFVNHHASSLLDQGRGDFSREAWLSTTHPDDRREVDVAIDNACHGGTTTSLRHRIVHRDGSEVWVDHSVTPFLEDDEPTGFVSTLVDVTVERTAMAELAASRDFTEALLDTAGVLVVVVDRNGIILRFNRAS
jgi:PAS domain S-box-containing protein